MATVMRSVMYVPANNERFIKKMPEIPADILTFDVEDAVPPAEKENARKMTREHLVYAGSGGSQVYVRVNGYHTPYTEDDLKGVVYPGLDGVTLPKTRGPEDVRRLDASITALEKERGIPEGHVKISILLETAIGVQRALECCTASPRLVSAFFGVVDYCTDMRIQRTDGAQEQMVARTIVAMAARAAGLVALDGPFANFSDIEAFRANTLQGRTMGYEGRMIIHPSQIPIAHELYSPSAEAVREARRIVEFFETEGLAKGLAAVPLDGKMVDTPVYVDAQNILEADQAIRAFEANRKQ